MKPLLKFIFLSGTLGISGVLPVIAQQLPVPTVNSIDALKQLQQKVQNVVETAQPATVALTSIQTGSWGSGVVINKAGLILSAAHVVQGTANMTVIFPDGKEFEAKVLGANRTKDIAMLQIIKPGEYPNAQIGSSDHLKVGDFVVSMAHAGGFDVVRKPPVRFGRVISKNPNGFFTSDCTLIGGDSGGPIFDLDGNVVGINSSIGYDWKANNHAGISGVVDDWKRLLAGETWGNLHAHPLANPDSPIIGFALGPVIDGGVMVEGVFRDGPAFLAGIREGDVIHAINGHRTPDGKALLIELNRYRPGQTIEVRVKRGTDDHEFKLKLLRRGDHYQE